VVLAVDCLGHNLDVGIQWRRDISVRGSWRLGRGSGAEDEGVDDMLGS
jgi:hypothetical protein